MEDQLDDLTELLKSALGESNDSVDNTPGKLPPNNHHHHNNAPSNQYHGNNNNNVYHSNQHGNQEEETDDFVVNTRNPGKIDRSFIENIERETLTLARKVKYFLAREEENLISVFSWLLPMGK